tara:strand:+ start:58 stop:192 length:135 start_codon:yes stop_codon:yes gene_type:complete
MIKNKIKNDKDKKDKFEKIYLKFLQRKMIKELTKQKKPLFKLIK